MEDLNSGHTKHRDPMLGPRIMRPAVKSELTRQRTTKDLINRFEYMSNPTSGSLLAAAGAPPSSKKFMGGMKTKSPLRKSFHSLVFAIRKGKDVVKDKVDDLVHLQSKSRVSGGSSVTVSPSAPSGLSAQPDSGPAGVDDAKETTSPTHMGDVLYLSQLPSLSSPSPMYVWTTCTATLNRDHILLTWTTPQGNPCHHRISLTFCADVRSLALNQIDLEERALLPNKQDNMDEFKVFEMLFEGRPREKFAAASIQERAGWVSAIWNAVLSLQDGTDVHNSGSTATRKEERGREGHATSYIYEPSLPTTPEDSAPPLPLKDSELSTSFSGSSPSAAFPQRPSAGAANSSSLASPDHASALEECLKGTQVLHSNFSSISKLRSKHSSTLLAMKPAALLPGETVTYEPMAPSRQCSEESDSGDSIIDSYGDAMSPKSIHHLPSPIQAHSGGTLSKGLPLTTAASPSSNQMDCDLGPCLARQRREIQVMYKSLGDAIEEIRGLVASKSQSTEPIIGNLSKITNAVEGIKSRLEDDLPRLLGKVEDIYAAHCSQDKDENHQELATMLMRNMKPSNVGAGAAHASTSGTYPMDISSLCSRVEALLTNHCDLMKMKGEELDFTRIKEREDLSGQLSKIATELASINDHFTLQGQQQVDSVRYLNELNSWLASFVNTGTAQIQDVAVGIQRLQDELGCNENPTNVHGGDPDSSTKGNILQCLRELVLDQRTRDRNTAALHASVCELLDVVHVQAENRNTFTPHSVMGLIEHQRQGQENLLRALTSGLWDMHTWPELLTEILPELSNEIRGERLRFVEAMSKATAINVQAHVEQFKKELTREVLVMTQEVGRLHRDRQVIENQIADLFSFYSKQKQAGAPIGVSILNSSQAPTLQQHGPQSRPLPSPSPWSS